MRRRLLISEFLTADHQFIRQAVPQKTAATLLWNATSTAELTVKDSHPVLSDIIAEPGVRCAVWMATIDDGALRTRRLLEGRIGELSGDSSPYGTVTIPVVDDFDDFSTLLGWQVPTAPIGGQGASEYWRQTSPSETRAKAAIAANASRLGRPWDVAPSLGRGTSAPIELRMDTLSESLLPALVSDRLQLTIGRDRATNRWDVDVIEGQTFPRPITPQSGVLQRWSWEQRPATATRAVVGGRGDGTEREFALVIDHALEAQLGVAIEMFVEARNAEVGADLAPYGWAALAKHAATSALTAELRETSWFRFGETYELGDRLPVKIGALEFEDVITQVDISADARNGFVAVPTVGLAKSDPQAQLVSYVRDVATAVRQIERR
ncbi:MAG: hypothetical protein K0S70_2359 [Microbacterium sp.]|jgi:hypothetical protein|nr:hypothetical protein [Microbacterium sp.]